MRLRQCGAVRYQRTVQLLTAGGAVAWWQGVICCRARVCPPCFVARRFGQALEIEHTVTERESETRQQSYLATFTVRHSAADPVSLTRDVRAAWRFLLQSRAWRTFVKEHQLEWVVAEEVTRGEKGWHPHMHAMLMPRRPFRRYAGRHASDPHRVDMVTIDGVERAVPVAPSPVWEAAGVAGELESYVLLRDLWERAVRRKLGPEHAPDARHGVDVRPCDSAAYLTKLGLELADPAVVKGRSPLAMLEAGDVDRYMELQMSRSRARDITFSRGLAGIRDSMPAGEPPAELLELVGSDWFVLRSRGWEKPLEVAERAKDPESAAAAFSAATGRRRVVDCIEP